LIRLAMKRMKRLDRGSVNLRPCTRNVGGTRAECSRTTYTSTTRLSTDACDASCTSLSSAPSLDSPCRAGVPLRAADATGMGSSPRAAPATPTQPPPEVARASGSPQRWLQTRPRCLWPLVPYHRVPPRQMVWPHSFWVTRIGRSAIFATKPIHASTCAGTLVTSGTLYVDLLQKKTVCCMRGTLSGQDQRALYHSPWFNVRKQMQLANAIE
jgi:hypothetical protein